MHRDLLPHSRQFSEKASQGDLHKFLPCQVSGPDPVLDGHFSGGSGTATKSLFDVGEDIYALAKNAESVKPVPQLIGNNFERIVNAGRIIGVDRLTGLPTSIYTVITNPAGQMVTMFPGKP